MIFTIYFYNRSKNKISLYRGKNIISYIIFKRKYYYKNIYENISEKYRKKYINSYITHTENNGSFDRELAVKW